MYANIKDSTEQPQPESTSPADSTPSPCTETDDSVNTVCDHTKYSYTDISHSCVRCLYKGALLFFTVFVVEQIALTIFLCLFCTFAICYCYILLFTLKCFSGSM